MDVEKKNRIVAAGTVAAVLLIVIFTVVIICQIASIVHINNEKAKLQSEIRSYEQLIKNSEDELGYLKSWEYQMDMLAWHGYHPPKN